MRAVVLAGGKGSRLYPLTLTIPKPLVPIGRLPIIEIVIRQLAAQGFERITISVGFLSHLIEAYCGDGSQFGVSIDYLREEEPLGTVGCLALIEDLDDQPVLLINGDTLTDLDMGALYRSHDSNDALTICAKERSVEIDFGVLRFDDEGLLSGYDEKPELSYDVSMGVNVVSPQTIKRYASRVEYLDLPTLVRRLLDDGERVRVHAAAGYWLDLGRMDDLERGIADFEAEPERFLPT